MANQQSWLRHPTLQHLSWFALGPGVTAVALGAWMCSDALRTGGADPDHGGGMLFVAGAAAAGFGVGACGLGLWLAHVGYRQAGQPGVWAPVRWAGPFAILLTGVLISVAAGLAALMSGASLEGSGFRWFAVGPTVVGAVAAAMAVGRLISSHPPNSR